MEEIWKTIEKYPNYEVSNKGRVRNKRTNYILKPLLNEDNYYYVDLYRIPQKPEHNRIHRLVATAFIGDGTNMAVNHKDGNKLNNNADNLEWVTPSENSTLASMMGLYVTRPVMINETQQIFSSIKECADYIGCRPSNISAILNDNNPQKTAKGYTFSYVTNVKNICKPFMYDYQLDAVEKMKNGCILNGTVGSGKSRTSLYYYFTHFGGVIDSNVYKEMDINVPLYIITTAKKRDSKEWENEIFPFRIDKSNYIIDSWNNIKKYINVQNAFFIFDEQRVVGYGTWTKSFLKITKNNQWILLTATAGDKFEDYIPVFIANGFFKNKTDFCTQHLIYDRYCRNYPKVTGYINTGYLNKLRRQITVVMKDQRHTQRYNIRCTLTYDKDMYKTVWRERWNPYDDEPIQETGKLFYLMRRVVNSDPSRLSKLEELLVDHAKVIIFYNFTYELELMKDRLIKLGVPYSEWNGQRHEEILKKDRWVYLVQYTAGAEGWNCIETDTIIFYSQTYSYRAREQAAGRIDRMNTPFTKLYYYHFVSFAPIDVAIQRALNEKRNFNENMFLGQN